MADKFKLGAKRVIAANRLAANTGLSVLGQPAGVDLRAPPPHLEKIKAPVVIHVMDYDADRIRVADLTNDDLEDFLEKPRPSCSKVRWINVRGISFDVIRVLELHPLAVEDIFSHHHRRIKADFYDEHVFISTMMLALEKSEEEQNHSSPPPTRRTSSLMSVLGLNLKDRQRSSKTDAAPLESVSHGGEVAPSNGSAEDLPGSVVNAVDTSARSPSAGFVRQRSPLSQYTTSSSDAITSTTAPAKCDKTTSRRLSLKKVEDEPPMSPTPGTDFSKKLFGTRPYFSKLSPKARKALERPEAIVEQASFFLLKSGVVISIFQKEGSSVTDPIYGRVQRQNTMLRDKSDPSFLLHALVDSVSRSKGVGSLKEMQGCLHRAFERTLGLALVPFL
ncbi:hypothetical protein HK102_012162 [Quaeritorhiza haematococci]|nr:hypothetical protein HK102_012162 [Quaeritorhiza haematococci]